MAPAVWKARHVVMRKSAKRGGGGGSHEDRVPGSPTCWRGWRRREYRRRGPRTGDPPSTAAGARLRSGDLRGGTGKTMSHSMNRPFSVIVIALLAVSPHSLSAKKIVSVRRGTPGPMAGKEDTYRIGPMFKVGHWTPVPVAEARARSRRGTDRPPADADDLLSDYDQIPSWVFGRTGVRAS